jgi:hypothetical protein
VLILAVAPVEMTFWGTKQASGTRSMTGRVQRFAGLPGENPDLAARMNPLVVALASVAATVSQNAERRHTQPRRAGIASQFDADG